MKTYKILLFLALALPMSVAQAQDYNHYSTDVQSPESELMHLLLLSGNKGLLASSEVALGTILTSHHFNDDDYNETHNGIYLSVDQWSFGQYKNSGYEQSNFVTYNAEIYKKQLLEIEVVAGVADGYQGWDLAQGEYLPILGFSTKVSYFKALMSFDVVAFGLELPLN